jgi:hypothetical protein
MLIIRKSKILQRIHNLFLSTDTASNEHTPPRHSNLDPKIYKGVIWNLQGKVAGRNEFGNMVISGSDLTFFKNVTPINHRIMLQVPLKSISKVKIDESVEEQFSIEIEYNNRDGELAALSFYVIMDTQTEGQDVWNRIEQFRSNCY